WTSAGARSAIPECLCSWLYQSKKEAQKARASCREPKRSGKAGWYFRVLIWASEKGLSLLGDVEALDGFGDQALGQGGGLALGEHPGHDVAAEDVEHDVEVVVQPFVGPPELGDIPGPDAIGGGGQKLGLAVGGMTQLVAALAARLVGIGAREGDAEDLGDFFLDFDDGFGSLELALQALVVALELLEVTGHRGVRTRLRPPALRLESLEPALLAQLAPAAEMGAIEALTAQESADVSRSLALVCRLQDLQLERRGMTPPSGFGLDLGNGSRPRSGGDLRGRHRGGRSSASLRSALPDAAPRVLLCQRLSSCCHGIPLP